SSGMEWGGAWALLCCVLLYQSLKLDGGPTESFQKKNTNHTPSPCLLHEVMGRLELGCRSHRWFPEPVIQWVTEDGQGLSADTESNQDSEKFFSVYITCQILNPLVQMEKKTTVRISGEFCCPQKSLLEAHCLRSPVRPIPVPGKVTAIQFNQNHPRDDFPPCHFFLTRRNPFSLEERVSLSTSLQPHANDRNVILDADTAHPRLEISADGRTVKDTGVIRFLLRNQKRFDSHLFVLAKEGYTSGKHYWEVNVGTRRNWALGIACESVARKGTLTLCPENGFWVIAHVDGQDYLACTNPWTSLTVTGYLSKIGIFLDIPAKKVSFYDVFKAVALYTLSIADGSRQEGKFLPFFSTGLAAAEPDTEPLAILQFSDDDE
uniref:Uncharacterized protein n=1 Tax=Geospiza parvula TaxID=87175 RepID=A0A8C3NKI8_GEOPR